MLFEESEDDGWNRSSKQTWLEVIDHRCGLSETIEENIELFGLPKSLS